MTTNSCSTNQDEDNEDEDDEDDQKLDNADTDDGVIIGSHRHRQNEDGGIVWRQSGGPILQIANNGSSGSGGKTRKVFVKPSEFSRSSAEAGRLMLIEAIEKNSS